MSIDTIFESGHTISTIIGWIIFVLAAVWIGPVLPHAYDAWLVNRKINLAKFDQEKSDRRQAAIDRLTKYHDFVIMNSSWQNRSRILNDFGKHTIIMATVLFIFMIIGIFFPTIVGIFL